MIPAEHERRYLEFIKESIDLVRRYAGPNFPDFRKDQKGQDAVIWRLQSLADAAWNHLSDSLHKRHPDIPWRDIYGSRNIAAHGYAGLHLERIWEIIEEHLEPLYQAVVAELGRSPRK